MKALQLHVLLALVAVLAAIGARRREADVLRSERGERLVDCAVRAAELRAERRVRVEAGDEAIVVAILREGTSATFVGGRSAAALLEDLGALTAVRRFTAAAAADYGFGDARLRVECAEESHEWALGGSPPGSADRYLRGDDDTIHLIDGSIVRSLEAPEVRLMRRALHDFDERDLSGVRVTLPGRTLELLQRFGEDPRRRRYVDPARPEERVPAFDRLMGAHRNLRAEAGAEPVDGDPLASLTFLGDDDTLGRLEVHRIGTGPRAVYVVRTDAIGWVRVPRSTGAAFARALTRLR